jgi:tungstate transport system ATP-binding protein
MSLSDTVCMADGYSAAVLPCSVEIQKPSILPLTVTDLGFTAAGCHLLASVSFSLQAGSRCIVLGPNGAGKSLLLRLCHGLLPPASGRIDWAGLEPDTARQQVAMVFQHPVLLRRSAAANIAYALSVKGVRRRERKRRVAEALARTELTHLANRPARVLSAGEQQRLAIARAWALQPQVLFLDEPTSNLDPAAIHAIECLLHSIHHTGTTLMTTTHDLGQARRLATEVLFLHQGRLLEQTPADEFFAQPRSAEAAAFLRGELLC